MWFLMVLNSGTVTWRARSAASTCATVWPWMLMPCMASPGANADAVVSYFSPGRAARPKVSTALPWKSTGTRTPTGQALPPPPV